MAEQKEEHPSFRITYPAFFGRGAALRVAATIGGLSYEDYFLSMAESEKEKEEGKRRWTGVPEITGLEYIYIHAKGLVCDAMNDLKSIQQRRYIGRLSGLYPKNPVSRALVDELLDSWEDLASIVTPSIYEKDENKKKEMREALMQKDKVPHWFGKFEMRLAENEKRGNKEGYFVGDSVSIADLKAFYRIRLIGQLDHIDMDKLLEPNKKLKALRAKMKENEGLAKCEAQFGIDKAEYEQSGKQKKLFKHKGKNVYASL